MSTSVPVAGERCPRPPNSTREVQSSTNTPGGGEAARMPGKVTYEHLLKWRVWHAHSLNACEALTTFVHFSFSSPGLAPHGVSCRGCCPQHPRNPQGLPVGLTKPLLSSGLHRLDDAQHAFPFAQAPFLTPEVGRQLIGPTGGTLRYDAIVSISPANKGLGSVHSRLTSERHYIKISHFPEPRHYLLSLRTKNRV